MAPVRFILRPISVCSSSVSAMSLNASSSLCTSSAMFGRCTLTTTSRPSRSTARCTWPSDAAAIGFDSKSWNSFEIRTFSSSSMIRSTSANENGSTLSCSDSSAEMYSGGTTSGRVETTWPNFTYVGPISFNARANASARALTSGSTSAAASSSASMSSGSSDRRKSLRPYRVKRTRRSR